LEKIEAPGKVKCLLFEVLVHPRSCGEFAHHPREKEAFMAQQKVPVKHYQQITKLFPGAISALEDLGSAVRDAGPLEGKTVELIQLAGAAAVQSEGSVHSHTRRAIQEGATPLEVYHTLLLLVSTIGFPRTSAAMRWAEDILSRGKKK
jgi:4-carboxymuconolactone decarboxylase